VQGAPRGIERIALAAAVPTGGLLDAAAALVQSIAAQAHDVERVGHRDRARQFLAGVAPIGHPRRAGVITPAESTGFRGCQRQNSVRCSARAPPWS
jgi:hypothetical protein